MRLLITVPLLLAVPLAANAALLGSASMSLWEGRSALLPFEAKVGMSYDTSSMLFDDVVLTPTSAGAVLTATSSDADFDAITGMLTNGVSDQLYLLIGLGVPSTFMRKSEALWFSLGTNDFAGYDISSITLTVSDLYFWIADGWTYVQIDYTVRVYGDQTVATASKSWGGIKGLYRDATR